MLLKLYTRLLAYSETKFAPLMLALIAFWEAIIFPIPPDIILIPMSLANKKKAFIFASLTTLFSILGGMVGYLIGSLLWSEIGEPLIYSLGYNESYSSFARLYEKNGLIIVLIGALTPFPFKIVAILSGAIGYPFLIFIIAATASRGLRFYTIAVIIHFWGDQINYFLTKYLSLVFVLVTAVLIGAYWYLK
jgi:membrane protein YqaA with SNARE-associated domain